MRTTDSLPLPCAEGPHPSGTLIVCTGIALPLLVYLFDIVQKCMLLTLPVVVPVRQVPIEQGFSKGVPRNFWTVPREKVLGKCEHIKMVCVLNI